MGELKLGKRVLKTPAVCGAVMGEDVDDMASAVSLAMKQGADLVELRIDSLRDREGWNDLLRMGPPTIFTNRPKREGGTFRGTEGARIDMIVEAIENGVPCVDLELSTTQRLRNRVVKAAKENGVSVLMSHHDFSATPSVEALIGVAKKMARFGGDLIKVVTFANNMAASMRVLDFLIDVQGEVTVPVIAFAMGEAGRISRIASLLMGSPFTYASVGEPTAPGQLGVVETKQLLLKLTLEGR